MLLVVVHDPSIFEFGRKKQISGGMFGRNHIPVLFGSGAETSVENLISEPAFCIWRKTKNSPVKRMVNFPFPLAFLSGTYPQFAACSFLIFPSSTSP